MSNGPSFDAPGAIVLFPERKCHPRLLIRMAYGSVAAFFASAMLAAAVAVPAAAPHQVTHPRTVAGGCQIYYHATPCG